MSRSVIKLDDQRPEKPDPKKVNEAYRSLVMSAFDDLEHEEKRQFKDARSEVERRARQRL